MRIRSISYLIVHSLVSSRSLPRIMSLCERGTVIWGLESQGVLRVEPGHPRLPVSLNGERLSPCIVSTWQTQNRRL